MKKFILISTIAALGLGGCAHTKMDAATGDKNKMSKKEATCNPGDEGYPKCSSGGGVGGPIKGDQ